ncbi:hypothetical protein PSTG_14619, partial [Puccinia striiformis f. sp. tritici PST-78]
RTCKTQAIIYSGFSGSGKSTSLRLITNQFIKLSQNNSFGPSSQSSQALKLADQIPHLFLLLNSFTTAKTFPNPSASRLSTLLELHFDNLFHLADADRLGFEDLQASFKSLGFKPKHVQILYKLLWAILLLGNIHFEQSTSRDFQDQSASVSNSETLELVSGLLGVPSPDLARVLTNRVQYIRKETVTVLLRPEAAVKQRDNFTNALYGVLIAYVVETTNHKLFTGNGFINELQAQGGCSILQFDSPGSQGRSEELGDITAETDRSDLAVRRFLGPACPSSSQPLPSDKCSD